jgi:hypothetical protein
MSSIRLAAIIAIVLLAIAVGAIVRRGHGQSTEIATFEPQRIGNFQKPEAAELKKRLSSQQFAVTQRSGTEPAFHNAYWDNTSFPGQCKDDVVLPTNSCLRSNASENA